MLKLRVFLEMAVLRVGVILQSLLTTGRGVFRMVETRDKKQGLDCGNVVTIGQRYFNRGMRPWKKREYLSGERRK